MNALQVEQQLALIMRGADEILPIKELKEKLNKSIKTSTPLKVKLGVDPTKPDLHLGHSVMLRKLRQFQDLGHEAILIIGGFTAMIGDPTGQNTTRPPLTKEEVAINAQSYIDQAKKILDADRLQIVNNLDWLGPMSFMDVIHLSSKMTVARMIERDDFSKRFAANEPISLHEFLYPLAQGQDSIYLENDIELGGTDQKFNLLVGRNLQKNKGLNPQVCLMMPLLVGTDGSVKMSKSYDNYIGINEHPNDMYGKALSIPDELIYTYFELTTDISNEELSALKKKVKIDPRNAKHDLAYTLVDLYHSKEAAESARDHFEMTVIHKKIPADAPEYSLQAGHEHRVLDIMSALKFCPSNAEAKRLIKQGAVTLDEEKITDINQLIKAESDNEYVLKVGKRKYALLKSKQDV
tara:strand:- start:19844 stop:21067 length:1224 start_codon:yes stop_codon:yes gene_type:complete